MPVLGWDVMQCCRQVDSRVRVKWPNDLWIEGKKLGGILCEVVHLKSGQTGLVIGIGINLKGTNKERAYLSLRSDGYVDFFADVIRTAARCVKTFTPEKIKLYARHDIGQGGYISRLIDAVRLKTTENYSSGHETRNK